MISFLDKFLPETPHILKSNTIQALLPGLIWSLWMKRMTIFFAATLL